VVQYLCQQSREFPGSVFLQTIRVPFPRLRESSKDSGLANRAKIFQDVIARDGKNKNDQTK